MSSDIYVLNCFSNFTLSVQSKDRSNQAENQYRGEYRNRKVKHNCLIGSLNWYRIDIHELGNGKNVYMNCAGNLKTAQFSDCGSV